MPLLIASATSCPLAMAADADHSQYAGDVQSIEVSPTSMQLPPHVTEPPAGVGLLINSDKPLHYVVEYVLPDMPGAKANILVGDEILSVDDVPAEKIHNLNEMIARIRGSNGTTVKLKIATAGKARELVLTRGAIPTVQTQSLPALTNFGRESAVYFYQREEILPVETGSSTFDSKSVRKFLRNQITPGVDEKIGVPDN